MSYTARRMDPDEDGTLWRAFITFQMIPLYAFECPEETDVFGPYKHESSAISMITRYKGMQDRRFIEAHTESTDTHWKLVEEF